MAKGKNLYASIWLIMGFGVTQEVGEIVFTAN